VHKILLPLFICRLFLAEIVFFRRQLLWLSVFLLYSLLLGKQGFKILNSSLTQTASDLSIDRNLLLLKNQMEFEETPRRLETISQEIKYKNPTYFKFGALEKNLRLLEKYQKEN